jgi:hypothetical protein
LSEPDFGPQRAARLEPHRKSDRRQRADPDEAHRQGRQDRIAIGLLQHAHRRREVKTHPQLACDQLGLIELAAAHAPDIELLQRDHIRRSRRNHTRNPARRDHPVAAFAGVDVVGHDPEGQKGLAGGICDHLSGNAPPATCVPGTCLVQRT